MAALAMRHRSGDLFALVRQTDTAVVSANAGSCRTAVRPYTNGRSTSSSTRWANSRGSGGASLFSGRRSSLLRLVHLPPTLGTQGQMPTRPQSTSSYSDYEDSDGEAGPSRNPREPPRWYQRPVIWVLAFVPVFTGFLGVWQIKRLRWKLDLIDELESKLKREPLSLPRNIDLDVLLNNFTNRLFALKGRFPPPTPENTVFLGPRVRDGVRGYHVIQPLDRSAGGGQVVVDRGFVPKDKIINNNGDPSTWRLMDSAFDTSVGDHLLLLPRPKERNAFTPANDVDRHIWYFADVAELQHYLSGEWAAAKQRSASGTAAVDGDSEDETDSYTPSHGVADSVKSMLGLGREAQREILPVYLEEIFEGNAADAARAVNRGAPIGRAATVELRNQHAVYAATWFSLSAATSVMLALLIRRGPRSS